MKLRSMEDVIATLRENRLVEVDQGDLLGKMFSGVTLAVLQNEMDNHGRALRGHRYTDDLKGFALTLHYHSPKAYLYLKTVLQLPGESSMRNWLLSVDCKPGFLKQVLEQLSKLAPGKRDFSLVVDAMAIHKIRQYDVTTDSYIGDCDFGGLLAGDKECPASEVLVFLLVPFNGSTQYPLAYFLCDKVNSEVQAQLITTALHLTADHGLRVRNLTMDGAQANISTAKRLGVDLLNFPEQTWFAHPVLGINVYVSPDGCHMLKLGRNALGDQLAFQDGDGGRIAWEYIERLHNLQVSHHRRVRDAAYLHAHPWSASCWFDSGYRWCFRNTVTSGRVGLADQGADA